MKLNMKQFKWCLFYVSILRLLESSSCKYADWMSNIKGQCTPPTECGTIATECSKTQKLLQGSLEDVKAAQLLFCGTVAPNTTKYGYSHDDELTGPPLVCCSRKDVYTQQKRMCSQSSAALRVEFCGRTPVFYINGKIKDYYKEIENRKALQRKRLEFCNNTLNKRYTKRCAERRKRSITNTNDVSKVHGVLSENVGGVMSERRDGLENRHIRENFPNIELNRRSQRNEELKDFSSQVLRAASGKRKKRMAAGELARMGQFPFLAVIYYKNRDLVGKIGGLEGQDASPAASDDNSKTYMDCLGTLIHPSVVITTYNCLVKGYPSSVAVGQHDIANSTFIRNSYQDILGVLYQNGAGAQKRSIQLAQVPPEAKYTGQLNYTLINPYDLSLIKVEGAFTLGDYVQPVCLPVPEAPSEVRVRSYEEYTGGVVAVGYGFYLNENSKVPKFIHTTVAKPSRCAIAYRRYYGRTVYLNREPGKHGYICAVRRNGEGPCAIDEGGPLLKVSKAGYMYQVGIAIQQMPDQCGFPRPAIYIDVAQHYNWLSKAVPSVLEAGGHNFDEEDELACLTEREKQVFQPVTTA